VNNRSGIQATVSTFKENIRSARSIIDKFPQLQLTPSPILNLNSFVSASSETKNLLLTDLHLVEDALNNTARRVGLPVLVGLIGKYSSGKSSLINAFYEHIFADNGVPSELVRSTGNTSIDTKFTYITHPDFVNYVNITADIDAVVVDHPFFRRINFIDTPGTDWKIFTKEEINHLLSAADIMLFLMRPTEILDAHSTQALYIKFSLYDNIPMWYVFTRASDYTDFSDFGQVRYEEFKNDLSQAKAKLADRNYSTEEERLARDLVCQKVIFEPEVNTFLVDAKFKYYTKELLRKIEDTFISELAQHQKTEQLFNSIYVLKSQFMHNLAEAERHIYSLSNLIEAACVSVIQDRINQFKNTTISSKSAMLSQLLLSRINQGRLDTDKSIRYDSMNLSLTYTYEPPEVSKLKSRIDDMRQKRGSSNFIYKKEDIIFNIDNIMFYFDKREADIVEKLEKELKADKERESKGDFVDRVSDTVKSNDAKVVVNHAMKEINNLKKEFFETVQNVTLLYSRGDLSKTIFNRQKSLLEQMKQTIPLDIQEAQDSTKQSKDYAQKYASTEINELREIVEHRVRDLEKETGDYLNYSVYQPAQEAFQFLFIDTPLSTVLVVSESIALEALLQFEDRSPEPNIVVETNQYYEQALQEIQQIQASWQKDWDHLQQDFNALVQDAGNIKGELDNLQQHVTDFLEQQENHIALFVESHVKKMHGNIIDTMNKRRDIIQQAIQQAKKNRTRQVQLELLSILIGLLLPILELLRAGQTWIFLTLSVVAVIVASVMVMFVIRAFTAYNEIVNLEFSRRMDALKNDIKEQIQITKGKMRQEMTSQNHTVSQELLDLYDQVIDKTVNASDMILGRLEQQINVAAKLAVDTTRKVSATHRGAILNIEQTTRSRLSRYCTETESVLKATFSTSIDRIGKQYTESLTGYARLYKNLAKDIAKLRKEAQD
jgi:hypothetical protein